MHLRHIRPRSIEWYDAVVAEAGLKIGPEAAVTKARASARAESRETETELDRIELVARLPGKLRRSEDRRSFHRM